MQDNLKSLLKVSAISLITIAVATGCSVSSKKTITVSDPISILKSSAPETVMVDENAIPRSIAILPFVNLTEDEFASDLLRSTLQNHFSSKNFQLVNWHEVDRKLDFQGDAKSIDPIQAAKTLGVDAVLVTNVTDFEMMHAGVYAQISVGVEVKLVNTLGEILWTTNDQVTTRAGGISTSPWGLLLNAAVATMHLSEKNMMAAADELGRSLAKKIPNPAGYLGVSGPIIEQVLHDGADKLLNYGDTIQLGLRGETGMRASVSIDGIETFDLPEIEPGVYIKSIPVSKNWNSDGVMITGRLSDDRGNISTWISPAGLVKFDNIAPEPVVNVKLAAGITPSLNWQSADSDATAYNVFLATSDKRLLIGNTSTTSLTLEGMKIFETARFEIEALDKAGNASKPSVFTSVIYPVAGVENAIKAPSALTTSLKDNLLLSKSNSPFTLSSRLTISPGKQMFVEPGVEIMITQGGELNIEGDAWFWGNDQGITIKTQNNQSPSQYMVINSKGTVQLDNVTFENGDIAVTIKQGTPEFNRVKFINNKYNALSIEGSASPAFNLCRFEGSKTTGILVSDFAKPVFKQSEFINNRPFHIQSSAVYPIAAEGNTWQPEASSRTILGNVRY